MGLLAGLPQPFYDVFYNAGRGQESRSRQVQENPPDEPYTAHSYTYGCLGWTMDPADILTAAQNLTTTTLFAGLIIVPNGGVANRLSCAFASVQGTETNFNGVGLYSMNAAGTALNLVVASANQTWTGVSTTAITDNAFTAATPITPGYYWGAILGSTSGTAATIHGMNAPTAAAFNFSKQSGAANQVTKWRSFTLATQTTMPATITLSGTTASAFVPFLALS